MKGQLRSIILSWILMLPVSGGVLFKKSNKVSRDFAFCGTSNDKLYHSGDWDLLCVLDQNMKRSACDRDLEVESNAWGFFFLVCF